MGAKCNCMTKPRVDSPKMHQARKGASNISYSIESQPIITNNNDDNNMKTPNKAKRAYSFHIPPDFNEDLLFLPFLSKNCNLDVCGSMNRIQFILSHRDEQIASYGPYKFINQYLKTYNNTYLLDDYHHLMFVHEYEFEDIYNKLDGCNWEKCTSYTRNHRDRSQSSARSKLYNPFISIDNNTNKTATKQVNTVQIIDAIHCYFLHTFDCKYKLTKEEQKKLDADIQAMYEREKEHKSESDDDVVVDSDDNDDDVGTRVRAYSQQLEDQQLIVMRPRESSRYGTTKRKRTRGRGTKYCQLERTLSGDPAYDDIKSQRTLSRDTSPKSIMNKPRMNSSNERLSVNVSTDIYISDDNNNDGMFGTENDIVYSFGVRFEYHKSKKHDEWYVKPKWKDLKNELINNEYKGFGMEQWDELLQKATYFKNTKRVKEQCKFIDTGDVSGGNESILGNESMGIHHLISIMIYCNFDKLQAKFTESYRKFKNESNEDLKKRHCQWSQLGKFLRQVVEVYGTRISSKEQEIGRKLKFYHGINQEMVFVSTSAHICGPLSTSSDPFVAANFAGRDGLLLELSGYHSRFFDCCSISDYPNEKEKFFLGGYDPLSIETVINPRTKDYKPFIKAINVISHLFDGKRYEGRSEKPISKKTKKLVYSLLFYRTKKNDKKDKNMKQIEPYVDKLFRHYCKNKKDVTIDWKLMNMNDDRYMPSIKGFAFIKPMICMKTFNWIKMNRVVHLFQNLEVIQLNYIKLTKDVMDYILHILETKGNEAIYLSLTKIIIYQPLQKRGLSIGDALAMYSDKFRQKVKWLLSVEETRDYKDLVIIKLS